MLARKCVIVSALLLTVLKTLKLTYYFCYEESFTYMHRCVCTHMYLNKNTLIFLVHGAGLFICKMGIEESYPIIVLLWNRTSRFFTTSQFIISASDLSLPLQIPKIYFPLCPYLIGHLEWKFSQVCFKHINRLNRVSQFKIEREINGITCVFSILLDFVPKCQTHC